jgi:hypothetical protein
VDSAYNTKVLAHFGCTKFIVRQTDNELHDRRHDKSAVIPCLTRNPWIPASAGMTRLRKLREIEARG